jgi:hypothetical protein
VNECQCHICGIESGLTQTEKCKLCCDGIEHEFCRSCASDYQTMRTKFGTLEAGAAFTSLQLRRAALLAQDRCVGCGDSAARPVTASNPHGYCEGCEEIWRLRGNEGEQGPHSCGGALATQKDRS